MKKIVIVYDDWGTGHRRAAQILTDILLTIPGYETSLATTAELTESQSFEGLVRLYIFLIRRNWITLVEMIVNFGARLVFMPVMDAFSNKPVFSNLDKLNPSAVFSVTEATNKALGTYCNRRKIPFFIFNTTLSPTFVDHIFPNAIHFYYFEDSSTMLQNHDLSLSQHSVEIDELTPFKDRLFYVFQFWWEFIVKSRRHSIFLNPFKKHTKKNSLKSYSIGPLAEQKHFTKKDTSEIKRRFGITEDQHVFLIACGGTGGKIIEKIAHAIVNNFNEKSVLLVACATDSKTQEKIKNLRNKNSMITLLPFGHVDHFEELLAISDLIICRASTSIFVESLLKTLPLIIFGKTQSSDTDCQAALEKYKLGESCRNQSMLLDKIKKITANPDYYRTNIQNFLKPYPKEYEKIKAQISDTVRKYL